MSGRKDIPLEEFDLIISPPSNRLASIQVTGYPDGVVEGRIHRFLLVARKKETAR